MITSEKKLALIGSVPSLLSLALPFLNLKENRISDGIPFTLYEIPISGLYIGITIIVVLIICSIFIPDKKILPQLIFYLSLIYIILLFLMLSLAAKYIGIEEFPHGRITISAGFWIMISVSFFLYYGVLRNIEYKSVSRLFFYIVPVLVFFFIALISGYSTLAIVKEFNNESRRFFSELVNHFSIAIRATLFALIIGIPLGIFATRSKKASSLILTIVNGAQAVPSLALFGLLITPLSLISRKVPFLRDLGIAGIGVTPALIALTLYALLPIVKNTIAALQSIGKDTIEAGYGMGMSKNDIFFKIELPVSLPIIFTGIRISLVQTFGNTTVAALIGAGGLGYFIFRGLEQASPDLIVMGVIPIVFLVTIIDKLLTYFIFITTPKGLRKLGVQR